MDQKVGDMPFGEIMNQAVKLKTHQAKIDRTKWDSWPKFKQNTMFNRPELEEARALPGFEDRLAKAYEIKAEADNHFRRKSLYDASHKYEHAVAVFRWLQNRDPGWKKKGIQDSDISEHAYAPKSRDEAEKVGLFLVACYLNLARVYHKNSDTPTALSACDAALGVDPKCDKALLLRAQVRLSPASAGATEQDMAVRDAADAQKILAAKVRDHQIRSNALAAAMAKAQGRASEAALNAGASAEVDGAFDMDDAPAFDAVSETDHGSSAAKEAAAEAEANAAVAGGTAQEMQAQGEAQGAELAKRHKEVVRYLKGLRGALAEQAVRDKQWAGVFARGQVYDGPGDAARGTQALDGHFSPAAAGGEGKELGLEEALDAEGVPLKVRREVDDAKRLLQALKQANKHEDADRVRREISESEGRIQDFAKRKRDHQRLDAGKMGPNEAPHIDFFNPTEQMIKDAAAKDLDLRDPAVLSMLQKLQSAHESSGTEMTDATVALALDEENLKAVAKLREDVAPIVADMSPRELRSALEAMGKATTVPREDRAGAPLEDRKSRPMRHVELVEAMLEAVVEQAQKGEGMPDLATPLGLRKAGGGALGTRVAWALKAASRGLGAALRFLAGPEPPDDEEKDDGRKLPEAELIKRKVQRAKRRAEAAQRRTFRVTFAAASAFFALRLWWSGDLIQLGGIAKRSILPDEDADEGASFDRGVFSGRGGKEWEGEF